MVQETDQERRVRVPWYGPQSALRLWLQAVEGFLRSDLTRFFSDIDELMGTPQAQVDWTDPPSWIDARLKGSSQAVARAIWEPTQGKVNPRHTKGHWAAANHYGLFEESSPTLALSDRGKDFVANPMGATVRLIDAQEGLVHLLRIVSDRGPGRRGDFLSDWAEFLRRCSKFDSDATIESTLSRRLADLVDRGLLNRSGNSYAITDAGLEYLNEVEVGSPEVEEIRRLVERHRRKAMESLRMKLFEMDPIKLEGVVRRLLEKLGYRDVETTPPSGDGGVDVVGEAEVGITSVREVVQVKRRKNNIQRKDLDALRGSLHRFKAVRGTLITVGDFARGTLEAAFEPGAAPITLINGERLVQLLVENGIGVRRVPVELLELDEEDLLQPAEPTD